MPPAKPRSRGAATPAPVSIPDEGTDSTLRQHISRIFGLAQHNAAAQRKLAVQLRKIQVACCYEVEEEEEGEGEDGNREASPEAADEELEKTENQDEDSHVTDQTSSKKRRRSSILAPKRKKKQKHNTITKLLADFDEDMFAHEIQRCFLRVLPVAKGQAAADRVVRFVGFFLRYALDGDTELAGVSEEDEDEGLETPTGRLVSHLLSQALKFLTARDKVVRFRATQVVATIVNSVDTIDEALFRQVRLGLIRRLRDKEAGIRVQAVLGLGRLADSDGDADEDSDSDGGGDEGILARLLEMLQHDPNSEVRRALLLNLPLSRVSLPFLLERARDIDTATRRALYTRVVPSVGDFRLLSITYREKLLRWGLRDRDEGVRRAASRVFCETWISDCLKSAHAKNKQLEEANSEEDKMDEDPNQDDDQASPMADEKSEAEEDKDKPAEVKPAVEKEEPVTYSESEMSYALFELLERIDVINSGGEGGIAETAMSTFWASRPDFIEVADYGAKYWEDLTPESVFVARSFAEYCSRQSDSRIASLASERLPEVTRLAFIVKQLSEASVAAVQQVSEAEAAGIDAVDAEEDAVQREFCLEQVLHLALLADYSDEMGRRQMFAVLREAIALADLPEECTSLAIEALRLLCENEREFCGIVLEAVAEVHDAVDEDGAGSNSFHSAQSGDEDDAPRANGNKSREEEEEERGLREMMVNLKCLHMAICMLRNVSGNLEQNAHLVTMLNNLVVPAVRSQEAPIRERGLECLGLCCLLSENLATENVALFLRCFAKGHPSLQCVAIHILSDILLAHPSLLNTPQSAPESVEASSLSANNSAMVETASSKTSAVTNATLKILSRALKSPDSTVAAAGAGAAAKLMLTSAIADDDLFCELVIAYFDPASLGKNSSSDYQAQARGGRSHKLERARPEARADNPVLRQTLAYFLPVYARSQKSHAERLARVSIDVLRHIIYQGDSDEGDPDFDPDDSAVPGSGPAPAVSPAVVVGQIAEWTDPRRLVKLTDAALSAASVSRPGREEESAVSAHFLLAERILERLAIYNAVHRSERRWLVTLLGKLWLGPAAAGPTAQERDAAEELVRELQSLTDKSRVPETILRNTLVRVQTAVEKIASAQVAASGDGDGDGDEDVVASTGIGPDAEQGTDLGEAEDDVRVNLLGGAGGGDGDADEDSDGTVMGLHNDSLIVPMSSLVMSSTSMME